MQPSANEAFAAVVMPDVSRYSKLTDIWTRVDEYYENDDGKIHLGGLSQLDTEKMIASTWSGNPCKAISSAITDSVYKRTKAKFRSAQSVIIESKSTNKVGPMALDENARFDRGESVTQLTALLMGPKWNSSYEVRRTYMLLARLHLQTEDTKELLSLGHSLGDRFIWEEALRLKALVTYEEGPRSMAMATSREFYMTAVQENRPLGILCGCLNILKCLLAGQSTGEEMADLCMGVTSCPGCRIRSQYPRRMRPTTRDGCRHRALFDENSQQFRVEWQYCVGDRIFCEFLRIECCSYWLELAGSAYSP
ncbi:hypothetical protein SeLEV6574_g02338 [Synchytrium endobioticum]|uniref:Uncharacterized protein n=1 Tax=Synchytrium endobioticum TaxID=286115 RepID=A0A507D9A3_9FUNG|nr:hypothetical protein SeLEV6574_g02338 [Synchytrium endobioticum]